jgi:hypothetical protein
VRIHTAILSSLVVTGAIQIFLSVAMIVRSLWAFLDTVRHQINAHYAQSALALVAFVFGSLHTLYCSQLYFVGVGVWAPAGIFVTSVLRNRATDKEDHGDTSSTHCECVSQCTRAYSEQWCLAHTVVCTMCASCAPHRYCVSPCSAFIARRTDFTCTLHVVSPPATYVSTRLHS